MSDIEGNETSYPLINNLTITQQQKWKKITNKVKGKHNTFTLSQLKKRTDWEECNASIFKQFDQYHDQKTFDNPKSLPQGANLLSLCSQNCHCLKHCALILMGPLDEGYNHLVLFLH